MKRTLAFLIVVGLCVLVGSASAAEPLVATWRLQRQELNGQTGDLDPLALQISQSGDKLSFAFSVPINEIYFVTLSYTLRLDGADADIKDANGQKIGAIQMTKGGAGQFKFTMTGPNRPASHGTLTLSADGSTLVSESEAAQAGRTLHSKQIFARDR
jgi:hypothetical protein